MQYDVMLEGGHTECNMGKIVETSARFRLHILIMRRSTRRSSM